MIDYLYVACMILCLVGGQISIKYGVLGIASSGDHPPRIILKAAATNLWVVGSLVLAAIAAASWILALNKLRLSYAYPFAALTFPIVLFLSSVALGESVSFGVYLGVTLIFAGLVLSSAG